MANLNINRSVDDAFYRYKMPRIIAKVEGKGNGIKTVIVNMVDVAKALIRPPTYTTKYFGCELGAQTQFDTKNERYIVNGSHDASKLQDLLDGFIKRFVLCPECDNPETNLKVLSKKQIITQRCQACGHQGNIDMRHKLTTFILKNPPEQDPSASTTTPSKKDRKSKKSKGGKENGDASPEADGGGDKVEIPPALNDEDDVDWGEDTSDAAVQQRMEELTSAAKVMTMSEDIEKTQQERVDLFYNFIKSRKEDKKLLGGEKEKEIVAEAERLDVKDKSPMVLAELLYDRDILTQIKKYRTLFLRFTHGNAKAQKYLLGAFELLVGNVHRELLMPKVAHILKMFYDHDLVDEAVLVDWDKKVSKKYVDKDVSKEIHSKAAPFISWLQEAEEESSEEEEEEDGVEVVYSHSEKPGTKVVTTKEVQKHEEDDLDIDAI